MTTSTNKEEQEIYVSPENQMSEKEMAGFGDLKDPGHPIVEMEEGRVMPCYIFGGPLLFRTSLGDTKMDIMITISRHIKEKKLEIRGRMRYAATGRKTVFSFPEMFDVKKYDDARQKARNMYLKLIKESAFKPSEVPWELEIPFGTSTKKTIKLMDESGKFNIGIVPQN